MSVNVLLFTANLEQERPAITNVYIIPVALYCVSKYQTYFDILSILNCFQIVNL